MSTPSFDSLIKGRVVEAPLRPQALRRNGTRMRPVAYTVWGVLAMAVLVVVGSTSVTGASAYWAAGSSAGGSGTVTAATVPTGPTPTVTASGSSLIVRWTAVTMADGTAVTGYKIKRYISGGAVQTITTDCATTTVNLGCIEQLVPAGTWTYTITPVYSTGWFGLEGPFSGAITSTTTVPTNNVWVWVTP